MPIQCRLVDAKATGKQPGDVWFAPWLLEPDWARLLSDEYKRDWMGKRLPLVVRLPNGLDFVVDSPASGQTSGWTVTGEAPSITVSPSINCWPGDPHGWHGFLQSGVLTDDLEGRRYS
jgi:hypothetical protein